MRAGDSPHCAEEERRRVRRRQIFESAPGQSRVPAIDIFNRRQDIAMHEITLEAQVAGDNTLLLEAAIVLHEHHFGFAFLSWNCLPGGNLATLVVVSSESEKKMQRLVDRLAEIPGVYQVSTRGKAGHCDRCCR